MSRKNLFLSVAILVGIIMIGFFSVLYFQKRNDISTGQQAGEKRILSGVIRTSDASSMMTSSTITVTNTRTAEAIPQYAISSDESGLVTILYKGKQMTKEEYDQYIKMESQSTSTNGNGENQDVSGGVSPEAVQGDSDKDGLNRDQELQAGTDVNNPDTDGDGLTDGEEYQKYHSDPKRFDTDGDGLTDGEEVNAYDTNPSVSDTDGDGYDDGLEVRGGYNPRGSGKMQ